jgi:hypothetical protein
MFHNWTLEISELQKPLFHIWQKQVAKDCKKIGLQLNTKAEAEC